MNRETAASRPFSSSARPTALVDAFLAGGKDGGTAPVGIRESRELLRRSRLRALKRSLQCSRRNFFCAYGHDRLRRRGRSAVVRRRGQGRRRHRHRRRRERRLGHRPLRPQADRDSRPRSGTIPIRFCISVPVGYRHSLPRSASLTAPCRGRRRRPRSRILRALSYGVPDVPSALAEIAHLSAILTLPRGTISQSSASSTAKFQ
jgi:hypothetical protein